MPPRPDSVTTRNPATGETLDTYRRLTDDETDAALDRAAEAFEAHRQTPFAVRAEAMRRAADLLDEGAEVHGALMTREMGKPLDQAVAEARKCAWVCRYYAEHAEGFLQDEPRETDATRSFVAYEPLGPVLAVMPWNFPYWQTLRFAAPTIMAGGVGLLKHADNVLGCAEAMVDVFRQAGFDEGVFQWLNLDHEATARVIADDRVRAVTLTGSSRAGRSVGSQAGQALKPSLLELGGSDAFVVLADADLDRAVEVGVAARTQNNGQSCIAAKRFILEAPIADEYTARFVERMEALTVGDPTDPDTDLGPLAREDLRAGVHDQVERAAAEGARVLCGGTVPDGPGAYYPPTVLGGVGEGTVAFEEEIFGPVASLTVAQDQDDAVRLANATRFGLGGSVWTRSRERGERVARRIRSGAVFVNEMTKSHPNLPFGGVGDSGYGRELGRPGIRAFVNEKTVWVE
ncbi:NAD-dependent succinate-semialdehyde dehydrogenase [Rubrivirga sp. S365]|uniref:NAD-dependent succinate-semialdehyde dehydrogenase n=1 Tax=Rubrivirga sp. S365 TaxID=3076080 RepID=UPI0028C570A0|nr:NAD-dependent succinate-semialdehyde dehydrogenase [Rubrivirga sp. S365]MDT7855661.1 NAD-dependent succinate-semialdehyde dehydrogenase [Rubrivirga sp. S365]